jgi:hypothetical protein
MDMRSMLVLPSTIANILSFSLFSQTHTCPPKDHILDILQAAAALERLASTPNAIEHREMVAHASFTYRLVIEKIHEVVGIHNC